MPITNHVRKYAIGSRNARAQLPVPDHARVNVVALAILPHQQPTLERRLARVVSRKQRAVVGVPVFRIIEPALLNPIRKIGLRDPVGNVQQWMTGHEKLDRRSFVGYAFVTENYRIRGKLRPLLVRVRIPFIRLVVEDKQRPARIDEFQ